MDDPNAKRSSIGVESRVFQYFGTVRFDDTDANGHVNNGRYNAYCDEAALRVFASGGLTLGEAEGELIRPITRRAEYEYLGQLKHPDSFRVDSTIEFTKPTRMCFAIAFFASRTPPASAVASPTDHGWISREADLTD